MTAEFICVVFGRQQCDNHKESMSVLRPGLMEDDLVQFHEIETLKDLDPQRAWFFSELRNSSILSWTPYGERQSVVALTVDGNEGICIRNYENADFFEEHNVVSNKTNLS